MIKNLLLAINLKFTKKIAIFFKKLTTTDLKVKPKAQTVNKEKPMVVKDKIKILRGNTPWYNA